MTRHLNDEERTIVDISLKAVQDMKSALLHNMAILDGAGFPQHQQVMMLMLAVETLNQGTEARGPELAKPALKAMMEDAIRQHNEGEKRKEAEIGKTIEEFRAFIKEQLDALGIETEEITVTRH